MEEKVSGNVTIVPEVQLQDFSTLISNPTNESIQYWILKGEQSTWPFISMLKYRLMIELALDRILLQLRADASASAIQAGIEGTMQSPGTALGMAPKSNHHRRQKSGPKRLTPNHHDTAPSPPAVTRRGSSATILGGPPSSAGARLVRMTSHAQAGEHDFLGMDPYQLNEGHQSLPNSHDSRHYRQQAQHEQHMNTLHGRDVDPSLADHLRPVPLYDPKRSKSMN